MFRSFKIHYHHTPPAQRHSLSRCHKPSARLSPGAWSMFGHRAVPVSRSLPRVLSGYHPRPRPTNKHKQQTVQTRQQPTDTDTAHSAHSTQPSDIASCAATPRDPQGRRQIAADAPDDPLIRSIYARPAFSEGPAAQTPPGSCSSPPRYCKAFTQYCHHVGRTARRSSDFGVYKCVSTNKLNK